MSEEPGTHQRAERKRLGYGPVSALVVTVGVYFLAQVVVSALFVLISLLFGVEQVETLLSTSALVQFIAIALISAVTLALIRLYLKVHNIRWSRIGLVRPRRQDVFFALGGLVVYFVLSSLAAAVVSVAVPEIDFEQQQQLGFDRQASGFALLWIFLSLVVLPAFVEEVVMRGFLYTGLRTRLSFLPTALITSVVFAVAHLQLSSGAAPLWAAAVDTFVLALVLVYLREKTSSLWSPIGVHFLKNGLAFTFIFVFPVV